MSSCSSNDSYLHFNFSSFNFHVPHFMCCLITRQGSVHLIAFCITTVLLLVPLCILVFYVGLQRWRQQRSTTATSHSDIFAYHMVTMEMFCVLGYILYCSGIYWVNVNMLFVGLCPWAFTIYGEMFFHVLTCVERYLAVVHPITYLSLRGERGIRIRNISIGCVWLLCLGATSLTTIEDVSVFMDFFILSFSLIIICFCSISVLCVLIRPKPGEQGKVDQSKQRAFYTIVAILGVLLLRCIWSMIWVFLNKSNTKCVMIVSGFWFNLPCSLVLPLLFLHRAGIFACCKSNTK